MSDVLSYSGAMRRLAVEVGKVSSDFFFFNDTPTTEIYTPLYTLSLHDALPICELERHCGEHGAGPHLTPAQALVRESEVGGDEEEEDSQRRDEQRQQVGDDCVRRDAARVALEQRVPDRPDREAHEQDDEPCGHEDDRQRLPAQEGAVRSAVDDVERGLEHAEERER